MLEADVILQGRYRIIHAIGRGGMGAVYLATDQTFGSTIVIKQTLCEGADLEKAFQREARLLNTLRHGALPVVIDYFTESRGKFLVMQYIPGDDFGVPPDAMVRALATMNGQADPLQPAPVLNPAVPPAIGAVVHQAMAMARDQRPDSAAALRVAL